MGIANSVHYSLNSYLLEPKRLDLAIEPDQLEGRSCQRLAWRSPQGVEVRLWIAEEFGPSVVRLEEAAPAPGKALTRTESEYQRDAATGIWFPSKITDTMFDGDRKMQVATTTIRIKSMNQRLDPRTFTMAGLGIPKGTCVLLEDQEGPFLWDGSKVVRTSAPPRRARELARLDAEDVILPWTTILLLANGVVLAGLATFALWRFMRSG